MKKRVIMKKWVEYLLIGISVIAVLIGASECDDTLIFVTTHLGAILVLSFVGFMFMFYGRDGD